MFEIITHNFGFWFNLIIPIVFAAYLALTHKEYIWKEFGLQSLATFAYVILMYLILFITTTNLIDTEYWNGKVTKFEYYEEWTERVEYQESYECGTSKQPKTCYRNKVRYDYHFPYWELTTSNNESISISEKHFLNAASKFGQTEKDLFRSNQSSFGDGNKFVSYPTEIIQTSVTHSYENLVVAAKQTVLKATVSDDKINYLVKIGALKQYPTIYKDDFGATKLNRIIDTTKSVNTNELLKSLNLHASYLGTLKQANPIIYITNQDRTFKAALEHYWNKAKKNDIVLILGVNGNEIIWSDVITWTNNSDFIVDCSKQFKGLDINDSIKITDTFANLIKTGYTRKPMKEFEYLKENTTLDWQWQLLIFLGNVLLSFFIFRYLLTNYERKNNFNFKY